MRHVTITIASVGRPSLRDTILSLNKIRVPADVEVDIVVADDDPGGAAARLLAEPGLSKHPLTVVRSASRNIYSARNATLDAARGEYIAFVDDDEWVTEGWLEELFAALAEFQADCVFGPVFPVYPEGTADWMRRSNVHYADWGKRGQQVKIGRTGNALMRREIANRAGLRFNPAAGKSGGGDTEYFRLFGLAGGRMVVTDDAAAYEYVPPERLSIAYVRRRALRTGQSYAASVLTRFGPFDPRRLAFHAGSVAKAVAAFVLATICLPVDRAKWLVYMRKAWSNVGKLRTIPNLELPTMY